MTLEQLNKAMALAKNPAFRYIDDEGRFLVDLSVFNGFALKNFQKVYVTLEQVAGLLRWQYINFGGSVDGAALDEVMQVCRKKFVVVGDSV